MMTATKVVLCPETGCFVPADVDVVTMCKVLKALFLAHMSHVMALEYAKISYFELVCIVTALFMTLILPNFP